MSKIREARFGMEPGTFRPAVTDAPQPATRARYMKTFVAAVDRLPADRASAIRGRVDPQWLRRIETAGSLQWLPLDYNAAVTDAVMIELSSAEAERFFCQMILDNFDTPLFATLVRASIRLLGLDPAAMAKMITRVVHIMFRENGTWNVKAVASEHAVVSIRGLALPCRTEHWITSAQYCLTSFHPFVQLPGEVTRDHVDISAGSVDFSLRWVARAQAGASSHP